MPPPPEQITILMVDDDSFFRSGLLRVLHSMRGELPARVTEASCGEEAVELLRTHPFDCALLDYQMPGGDGLHWLREFRQRAPDVPVIMVTGVGNENVAVEAMKNGARDYLVKGAITQESLLRTIRNALELARLERTIRQQQDDLLQAERQRVMIESLGAACHHIGQPATVIRTCLDLMSRTGPAPEIQTMIAECTKAADQVADVLDRLRAVSEYRTAPYRSLRPGEPPRADQAILAI